MKHLLTTVILLVTLSVVIAMLADRDSIKNPKDYRESYIINDDENKTVKHHYGDTLYQYDGKTVIYDYFGGDDEYISSLTHSNIITYRDTIALDTCVVNGNGWYHAAGEILKFSIGVDTVYYNFKHLPKSVAPELELMPTVFKEHFYAHTFALSDSSWNCDFKFRVYLPDRIPAWTKQFIATMIHNDLQGLFMDNKGADKILKEYYGIKTRPKKINGIDASSKSPRQIAGHFAKEHERLYRKEYCASENMGPKYDYMFEMFPAWQSSDGKFITYRFYTYYYTMGMHGFMEEYYLTFNNVTGHLLGFDDLFRKRDFKQVVEMVSKEITKYNRNYGFDTMWSAWIKKDELSSNATSIIKEVRHDTLYYPRPALTNRGVVFSYQPYEIAAFSEGVRHFVIPYNQLKLKINSRY